jgi:hypothetical protein
LDPISGKTHQTLYQARLARPTQASLPPVSRRIFYAQGGNEVPRHQGLVGFFELHLRGGVETPSTLASLLALSISTMWWLHGIGASLLLLLFGFFSLFLDLCLFLILPFYFAGENHNRRGIRTNVQLQPRRIYLQQMASSVWQQRWRSLRGHCG